MAAISSLRLALRGRYKILNGLRSKDAFHPRSHGIKRSSQSGLNMPLNVWDRIQSDALIT